MAIVVSSIKQNKQEEIALNLKKLAAEGDSYRSSNWGHAKFKLAFDFLFSFIDKKKEYSVLDLGSGGGLLLKELSRYPNFHLTGIDLTKELLEKVTSKRVNCKLVHGDIEDMPFKDQSFDIVIHNQTLHHFRSREKSLREIYRILRPGGLLMSIETNGLNPYVLYGHKAPWKVRKRFISSNQQPFSIIKFKKELDNAKFAILGVKMINHLPINSNLLEKILENIPGLRLVTGGSMVVCSKKYSLTH